MTSLEELANCVKQNDAMSFLLCYLKLLNKDESLELPKSTTKKNIQMEWEDIVPSNCKNGIPSFYSSLTNIWLSLLQTPNIEESSNVIQTLLTILEHNQQISQAKEGGIIATTSNNYNIEKTIMNSTLSQDAMIKNIEEAIYKNDTIQFLQHYCILCIHDKTKLLPQKSTLEKIEQEWKTIIQTEFQIHTMNLKELSKVYFNLVHTYGIPSNETTILQFYKSLLKTHKEI